MNPQLRLQLEKLAWLEVLTPMEDRTTQKIFERLIRRSTKAAVKRQVNEESGELNVSEHEGQVGDNQEPRLPGDRSPLPLRDK